jgi:hypothetical protein
MTGDRDIAAPHVDSCHGAVADAESADHERHLRSSLALFVRQVVEAQQLLDGSASFTERLVDIPDADRADLVRDALSNLEEVVAAVWRDLRLEPEVRSVHRSLATLRVMLAVDLEDLRPDKLQRAWGRFPSLAYEQRIAFHVAALFRANEALADAIDAAFPPNAAPGS